MPVNLIHLKDQIPIFSQQAAEQKRRIIHLHEKAETLFTDFADQLPRLQEIVNRASLTMTGLRCAKPVHEALTAAFPVSMPPPQATIFAADGSQINPSTHGRVEFCVINVGIIKLRRGSGLAPEIATISELLNYDELFAAARGLINEAVVALRRDLRERQCLLDAAVNETFPTLTLTDGPLELYHEEKESKDYTKSLTIYLDVLRHMAARQLICAGYVDRPRSDLVVRLLDLAALNDEALSESRSQPRSFEGLSDIALFADVLKQPGARSAIFEIISPTAKNFTDELTLHFFYMNVGSLERPQLVRVEMPRWVAENPQMVDILQALLFEQAQISGMHPYPYVLTRAHEIAVVNMEEHTHVEDMIVQEFIKLGIPIPDVSNKQAGKNFITGKKRYQP